VGGGDLCLQSAAAAFYKGALAKPIKQRPMLTFAGAVVPKRIAAYRKRRARHERANAVSVEREFSKKMRLLFKHYGIANKENMAALAFALAVEHVPGFRVQAPEAKSKRGRKLKWHAERLDELYRTVESVKTQHRFTDRQALKFIVSNERHTTIWGVPKGHKGSKQQWIQTLESRLQSAKHLQKLYEQAESELEAIAKAVKFRN
jgi:hypothetical protein